ncbi:MAG: DMT family transporter, partial [Leptospiraceae bacterium]|nr:DMT family transporter [Leptospiraceae bacterium]
MNFTYLLILAMVIWGVSWASAKQISGYSPPEVLIFWRNLATFIFLFPFLFILKQKVKFSKKIFLNSLFGAILMSTYNYLFFAGLKNGLAGAGGVLVTTLNPILNFILVSILYHHVWKKREIIGLIMGFSGGLIIIRIWEIKPEDIYKSGNLFFLIASLMWAFLSIQTHRAKKYMEPIPYSFLVYGFSTIITFFFAFFYDWTAPIGFDLKFWINLIYLSGISTAFATTIYFIASS